MKKVLFTALFLLNTVAFAASPQNIYIKKCAICHQGNTPDQTYMSIPNMYQAMEQVTMLVSSMKKPNSKEELKSEVIAFLNHGILYKKDLCNDNTLERIQMNNTKSYISEAQLQLLLPFIYDSFAPQSSLR